MMDPGHHNVDEMDKQALPEESAAQDRLKAPHPIWDWAPDRIQVVEDGEFAGAIVETYFDKSQRLYSDYPKLCGGKDWAIHELPSGYLAVVVLNEDRGAFPTMKEAKHELKLVRAELLRSHEESLELARVDAKFYEGVQYDEDGYKILKRK